MQYTLEQNKTEPNLLCGHSRVSGQFTNTLRAFQIVLKFFKPSEKCSNTLKSNGILESFWRIHNIVGHSGNLPEYLETFQCVQKIAKVYGMLCFKSSIVAAIFQCIHKEVNV